MLERIKYWRPRYCFPVSGNLSHSGLAFFLKFFFFSIWPTKKVWLSVLATPSIRKKIGTKKLKRKIIYHSIRKPMMWKVFEFEKTRFIFLKRFFKCTVFRRSLFSEMFLKIVEKIIVLEWRSSLERVSFILRSTKWNIGSNPRSWKWM
jgi:hypothetical protein